MNLFECLKAIFFGIIEGVSEWMPISSTGHMIILNEFLKLDVSDSFFDLYLVVIQFGAALAALIVLWKEIWPFGKKNNNKPLSKGGLFSWIKVDVFQMWFKIAVACIPAAIVGLLFDDWIDEHFYNYIVVACALAAFGIAFLVIEKVIKGKDFKVKSIDDITYKDALIIGLFQLLAAIFPGTSRSGSTIVGSLIIGIDRNIASKFTFYMAIPVMLGASVLKIFKFDGVITTSELGLLAIGMVSAFVVSLIVIKSFLSYIRKHDFTVFGWYRIVLAVVVVVVFSFFLK